MTNDSGSAFVARNNANAPIRVLLVDDNPNDRALTLRELRRAFPALSAQEIADLDSLQRAIEEGGFDAVITDYQLRWTDGLNVLRAVKARYPDCPVIMFTGTGTQEVAVTAMKAGLDDYVIKAPSHYLRLPAAVGSALERAETRRRVAHLEQERDRLLVQERAAREAAEAARSRAAFLAEASRVLASSLDYETTLRRVAELVVPRMADWCTVDIVREDGTIQRLAVTNTDPVKVARAQELQQRYPPDPRAEVGVAAVIRSGKPAFSPEVTDEQIRRWAPDAEHLEIVRQLGMVSYIGVPLPGRERTLGAIGLITAESRRRYGEDDLRLAEELARRVALAVENAQLYREAQQAIRTRDAFLSIAAHELKTPLTSLQGYTELLHRRVSRDAAADPRNMRAVQAIGAQVERLNALVGELLNVSRLQSDMFHLRFQPLDLAAVAHRVAAQVQPTLVRHTLDVSAPSTPLMVRGDERRIEQVLANLIHNAMKYSPAGGPITVELALRDNLACITIRDQGIGIPEAEQSQIFQRFFRAENAVAQDISGFGIGLYLVKEIVTRHGGTITVDSVEGQGSAFTVCLPCLPDAEAPAAPPS